MAVVHFVLDNDAAGLESGLVLFETRWPGAPEWLIENAESLKPSIEGFMTSFDSTLELLYCVRVKAVAGRNLFRVTDISLIADGSFSGWNFGLESIRLAEYFLIILTRGKGTINPYELIMVCRNA
jgi:hypothetical protein